MARSSILGGQVAPQRAPGHDVGTLGPSDSSDSGSDVQGGYSGSASRGSDSDSEGTGERASASGDQQGDDLDILPDRIAVDRSATHQGAPDMDDYASVNVEDLAADDDASDEEPIDG